MTSDDIERLRADTPGCAHVTHLNNAGASLQPAPVVDRVIAHLRREADTGGYEAESDVADEIEGVYASVGRLLGCGAHEVAVVDSATRAWNQAFGAFANDLQPGDRILTSRAEYASNVIALLQVARVRDLSIEVVPDDAHGQLDVDALRDLIDERVGLIAVTHVPTQGGLVNPAAAIGAIARDAEVPFLLDACQSAGQLPLDVGQLGVTALSATSRKFLRGPRGMGVLYVADDWIGRLEPHLPDLHAATWVAPRRYELRDDARRFELWETSIAAKLGLGVAVDYALDVGLDAIERRVTDLAAGLRKELDRLEGVVVRDQGRRRCGIIGFTVDGHHPDEVVAALRRRRINCSATHRSSARFDLEPRGIDALVRASVHYYNTEGETHRLVEAVGELLG